MFFDIGSLEFITLIVLAIMVFGPEKLPRMIREVAQFIRKVREFSDNAKQDIRSELGPDFKDFEFEDLNPKNFARKHLLDNEDLGLRELAKDLDVRKELTEVTDAVNGRTSTNRPARNKPGGAARTSLAKQRTGFTEPAAAGSVKLGKDGDAGSVTLAKDGETASSAPAGERSAPATSAAEATPFDADAT
ncbi:Sec-independent protein translocase TatB [Streptomyces sp. 3MP-14]|uniref:Sec-independent protein translocase protein TatB n=1 Tax=Streptomyces mimosae TaxID=2586635 RepID=A0A5N6A8H6_9ACTN|nr:MULTISPECIES: sec-independent translocase [Streptomyces]KAB8165117.1 Sec-independent protein translocase TatB [Streptomyces mimosae]KAB8175749.1 Sec-independent protein translocase TatB [Streptomyces sp. 3MP-14]